MDTLVSGSEFAWPETSWQQSGAMSTAVTTAGAGAGVGAGAGSGASASGATTATVTTATGLQVNPAHAVKRHEQDLLERLNGLEAKLRALLPSPDAAAAATATATATAAAAATSTGGGGGAVGAAAVPLALPDAVASVRGTAPAASTAASALMALDYVSSVLLRATSDAAAAGVVAVTADDAATFSQLVQSLRNANDVAEATDNTPHAAQTRFAAQPGVFDDDTQSFVMDTVHPRPLARMPVRRASASRSRRDSSGSGTASIASADPGLGAASDGAAVAAIALSAHSTPVSATSSPGSTPHSTLPRAGGGTGVLWQSPIRRHLDRLSAWDFDILQFRSRVVDEWSMHTAPSVDIDRQTMVVVAGACVSAMASFHRVSLDAACLSTFLHSIAKRYRANPYHNALHGADVTQSLYSVMVAGGLSAALSAEGAIVALLAAVCHDVGHLGVSNNFLVATQHPIALQYNDVSVLENMHATTMFSVLRMPGHNVLSCFPPDSAGALRKLAVGIILATDNASHLALHAKLDARLAAGPSAAPLRLTDVSSPDTALMLQSTVHALDVSNPAKPWALYKEWTRRVQTEFFAQGDEERKVGLAVPRMNDRTNPLPLPKMQLGFIHAIVLPMFTSLSKAAVLDVTPALAQLNANVARWEQAQKDSQQKA